VKNPRKLQEKLAVLLRNSRLHIQFPPDRPWTDLELKEVAWIVEDHVNRNSEVINSDPLKDWVEEYKFFQADNRT
jgi:hypothetical protein